MKVGSRQLNDNIKGASRDGASIWFTIILNLWFNQVSRIYWDLVVIDPWQLKNSLNFFEIVVQSKYFIYTNFMCSLAIH